MAYWGSKFTVYRSRLQDLGVFGGLLVRGLRARSSLGCKVYRAPSLIEFIGLRV